MKISICIPTYEAQGKGVFFLDKNISHILKQTYQDYEIVVSDHSKDYAIETYLSGLQNSKIKYFRYSENIGKPAYNTNFAIKNSNGDFIKLMNMDDYMECEKTLEDSINYLKLGDKWILYGFKHLNYQSNNFFNFMIPRIENEGKHLLQGINYVGCPSVGLIPRDEYIDTDVQYMIDCELWYRMFIKYGKPKIINDYKIVIGVGEHSLTSQLLKKQNELLYQDIEYCKSKYNL
jgi:glycosyltransferase involved in cell wall biosynthesis